MVTPRSIGKSRDHLSGGWHPKKGGSGPPQCIGDFGTQSLANTAWAFATAGRSDALLFAACATAAERRLCFGRPIRLLGGNHEIPRSVDFPAPLGQKSLIFGFLDRFGRQNRRQIDKKSIRKPFKNQVGKSMNFDEGGCKEIMQFLGGNWGVRPINH